MQFAGQDGNVYISLDPEDDEQEFLEALVRASYELAPMNPSWPGSYSQPPLSEGDVRNSVKTPPRIWDKVVIQMDQVHGRVCKTIVVETQPRHYVLDGGFFSAYRNGSPQAVLDRTRELLHGYAGQAS